MTQGAGQHKIDDPDGKPVSKCVALPLIVRQSEDLLEAVSMERHRRGITTEEMDDVIGVTRGHICKLENGTKKWGRLAFRMMPLVGWVLEYFGWRLVLMPAEIADALVDELQEIDTRRPYVPRSGASYRAVKMATISTWLRPT